MRNKSLETVLYSTFGVVAMFLILVAVNVIAALGKQRLDLTAEKAYTLSAGTRAILARLDTPVQVRFYWTKNENAMPVFLKTYAQRVDDLLAEYQQASRGMIEVQRLNPEPDSDAEDSAKLDGVEGQPLPTGEQVYLGVSVSMLIKNRRSLSSHRIGSACWNTIFPARLPASLPGKSRSSES
jgi:ABC-type uncharacterized transport system involved in gliding motility auxiliary subunit